jgi:hypothetical protein
MLRHTSQRDERRRRVLTEELLGQADATPATAAGASRGPKKTESYTEAARMEAQRPWTDLIPTRYVTLALLLLAGLTLVAGLAAAYVCLPDMTQRIPGDRLALFELAERGNLGTYFASVILLAAAATALMIYAIRRHKTDDYQGRYRIWLAAAVAWVLMSIDAAAGLHDAFDGLMVYLTGQPDGAGRWWSIGVWGLLLAALAVRLAMDLRPCKLSLSALIAALALWCAALAAALEALPLEGAHRIVARSVCALSGHLLLLTALGLYARHVLLDAHGLLSTAAAKSGKRSARAASKPDKAAAASTRIDGPHASAAGGSKRTDLQPAAAASGWKPNTSQPAHGDAQDDGLDDDLDNEDDRGRKPSRAERKRLRKQKMDQRRAGLR